MSPKVLRPIIKWSGSKRNLAARLHALWPSMTAETTYFEPFLGGGSMLPGRPASTAVGGDILPSLIGLWQTVATQPASVEAHYRAAWLRRQREGAAVYYEVRERFNRERSPLDLMILSRMCVNGLIRFNRRGDFNNSLHHTRPGIHPDRLASLLRSWSQALRGVRFSAGDYAETLAEASSGDCVFLDPPYMHNRGRYRPDQFDFPRLWSTLAALNDRGVRWMMTLDGDAGERQYTDRVVPASLWTCRMRMPSGNSPFTRLMKTSLDAISESVYVNFKPEVQPG